MKSIDPITLEVHWNSMISIVDEMSIALMKSAYSESVRESLDFSCGIFDSSGNMIAQSDRMGTPAHLGTMPKAVKTLLERYNVQEIHPGDVFALNDPYVGAGHIPDLVVITPAFFAGKLVAFACNIAHLPDMGGRGPGGSAADSHEIYEEGLFIPLVKLYRRNSENKEILDMIRANVRIPERVIGDIQAQVAANRLSASRMREFIAKYESGDLDRLANAIIKTSEDATRESIKKIPEGTYKSEDKFEDLDQDLTLKCAITIRDGRIHVDYSGSAPQSKWAVNSVLNFTFAYSFHALKCIINPNIPSNEGCMRPISLTAVEGSVFNPRPPAALGARHLLVPHINWLIFSALSSALPDKVVACTGHGGNLARLYGMDPRTKDRFIAVMLNPGGTGARPHKDGVNCMTFPQMTQNQPVEVLENVAPVMVKRREIRTDSGGPGKYRGGNGQVFEIMLLTNGPCTLLLAGDRRRNPPQGLFGGKFGAPSSAKVTRNNELIELHPKKLAGLLPGDIVTIEQSGGGGYGDPLERDLQLVLEDLVEGYVTPRGAYDEYGVVFNEKAGTIDAVASDHLRKKRRQGLTKKGNMTSDN